MIVEDTTLTELAPVRRVRRMLSRFERVVRPPDVRPGDPMPSVEGWVLFLTNLPANTTTDDIQDIFLAHNGADGEAYAPVREIKMPLDKNCECCGYALVELERKADFDRALRELQGVTLPFASGEPPAGEEAWRLRIAPTFLGEEEDDNPVAGEKRARD